MGKDYPMVIFREYCQVIHVEGYLDRMYLFWYSRNGDMNGK